MTAATVVAAEVTRKRRSPTWCHTCRVEDRQEGRSSESPLDGGAAAAGRPAPHGAPAGRGEPPAAPERGGAVTAPPRPWTALHFRVSFYPTAFLKVWPTDRAGTTFRSPRRLPGRHTERCVLAGAGDRARLSLRGPARQGSLGARSRGSFLAGCGARTPLCRERRWPEARARGLPASPSPQPAGHPGS